MASERRFDFRFSEATRIKVYDNGVVNRKSNLTTVCGGGSASQLRKRCFVKSGGLSHASPEALDLRYRLLFAAKARLFSTDVSVRFEAEDRGIKNRGNEPSSKMCLWRRW